MANVSTSRTLRTEDYITRPEFESFSKTVDTNFAENRTVLIELSRKIDSLATKEVDYKGVFAGVSVALTIILAIAGLFGWGLNNKIDSLSNSFTKEIEFINVHMLEMDRRLEEKVNMNYAILSQELNLIKEQQQVDKSELLIRSTDRWTKSDHSTYVLPSLTEHGAVLSKLNAELHELRAMVNLIFRDK